ncbi:hypothetical protein [Argonema antarcticum]|uniref:hypothetical protein n=1 Tax=Argonema antarcticum TaxID=2942763 RepID=UPI0020121DB5|nr:hypothetical protein [Argonema antarcticum]MCL1474041.1 hypothetical protein [Argonema antarcticum A004/B2]
MTTDSLLLAFPNFVESEPIEIDILRELDRALESVSSEPWQNTEETLNEWLRNHEDITDQLREFEESTREITKVKAQQPKTGVANVFEELSEAVKQKLKDIENGK